MVFTVCQSMLYGYPVDISLKAISGVLVLIIMTDCPHNYDWHDPYGQVCFKNTIVLLGRTE